METIINFLMSVLIALSATCSSVFTELDVAPDLAVRILGCIMMFILGCSFNDWNRSRKESKK